MVPIFDKKVCASLWKLSLKRFHWKLGLKLKKYITYYNSGVEAEKNGDKNGKALYKLMNNIVCDKPMKNVRNRINVRPLGN